MPKTATNVKKHIVQGFELKCCKKYSVCDVSCPLFATEIFKPLFVNL